MFGEFEANLLRAQVALLQNRNDDRRAALEAALAFAPKDETLMIELAEADLRTGNATRAAERLGACPADVCKSLAFIRTYLKMLKATENLQEAENLTVRAELSFSKNPEVLFMSGDILELRGKLSLAAKKYEKVIEFDAKHLEAYLRLADIQKREKAFDKAVVILDAAAKAFEGGGAESEAAMSIAVERGELLAKQGRFDEAREVLTQVVKVQPANAQARESLATLLVALGQPALAITHFDKLFDQGKTNANISLAFAEALIMSGRPDRAIEVLKRHLEANPKDLDALVKLGHAYVQKGRYEEAMAVLEHAVAINRNYAPAYYFAGLAEYGRQRRLADEAERRQKEGETVPLEQRPDFSKAVLAFSNARDKDPENVQYREFLAKSLMEMGKKRDLLAALEQYDAVLTAYRKYERVQSGVRIIPNAEVYFNRGVLASKLGRPREEILKNFQDALLLDSARSDYIARYGEELYKLQTKETQDGALVLEAKAYFLLVREHYSKTHVRSNYYLGRVSLHEWGKQAFRKPGDPLHKEALDYFNQVVAVGGHNEFPDVYFYIGNIQRELGVYRLADDAYMKYLDTYKRLYKRTAPNEKYVRELIKSRP